MQNLKEIYVLRQDFPWNALIEGLLDGCFENHQDDLNNLFL